MKILIPEISNPPETFLQRLILGLAEQGVEVFLATEQIKKGSLLNVHEKIRTVWKPSWNVPLGRKAFNITRILLLSLKKGRIKDFLKALRANSLREWYRVFPVLDKPFDLWYFPWILSAKDYLPYLREHGIPFVVSCRGSMVNVDPFTHRGEGTQGILREIFSAASVVHCVSRDILKTAEPLGLNPNKAVVIHPAVDVSFFSPPQVLHKDSTIHITTTGALIWRKGYEYALQAIAFLKQRGYSVHYHILGEGPERQRLLYTVDDLDLCSTVTLHGKCSPEEVRRVLQKSHIFLFSSLSEGLPNAVLEAMACGLPVVTSNCGGVSEAVTDGVEGWIVPVRDPEALAGAVERLILDKEMRLTMGEAARRRVVQSFNLSDQIPAFRTLFERVSSVS
ncbi:MULTISPECIES: glycosyltransferase family 4 protein [Anaerolinea]|uniref:Glycosyltransferase n=1 Tax=Anaerolinea thermophila (strain DSM 14523 / JCM 11388 / NBRC 100420 / UNI-1) TaxID=926569 RepID=E8N093_ANATU|nr:MULTISPECIES: glycosyltransferase family 4 protein [Anaerolinea]BAJ64642.1 putative glycosyltransferase [Anaerolinea thermophila UNI-1]